MCSEHSILLIGCKKLRSLLLNAEDGNQSDERIPVKNSFSTNCSEDTKMKAIVRALLSDVDTDTDTDDNENEVNKDCETRLSNFSACVQSLSPSQTVFDELRISDTSNLKSHKDEEFDANSTFLGNDDDFSRLKSTSKNNNKEKDREEDNDDNSNNSSHSSNSNHYDKKRNKHKKNITLIDHIEKLKVIDEPLESFQDTFCNQIETLLEKLDFHMKKIHRRVKFFPKKLIESTSTLFETEYLKKNKIKLCQYWSEIAILIGRFDYLESHFHEKEEKISNNFKRHRYDVAKDVEDEIKENKKNSYDNKNGTGNHIDNDKKLKEKVKLKDDIDDVNLDIKKNKQLNMRYMCNSDKLELGNIVTNKCTCGYDYNHDNRAIIYNTRGYPFGYNNHFISGNNYYGYPPPSPATHQGESNRLNTCNDHDRGISQKQKLNLSLNQTKKNHQQFDTYNSNLRTLNNNNNINDNDNDSNHSNSHHNNNLKNNSNSNNNFDSRDEIDENLDQNSDCHKSSGDDISHFISIYFISIYFILILLQFILFQFTLFQFILFQFILFQFTLFQFILFQFTLFQFTLFQFILFYDFYTCATSTEKNELENVFI